MDTSRDFILDRITSRAITPGEFNYDKMQAPPLSMLLSPYDIQELHRIATSLKLSAKPQEKYKLIDNVMRNRGFVKMAAGTNRIAYRHPEDTSFLIKIATDNIGMGDNPAEYRNQFIFKPFVTKCFEVSPCGTVGVFERVDPIISREEFLSVAGDIFTVINEWFIGEYVLADFGSNFFMNWGIRHGFGPVLLDYPYMYKIDGDKLYCRAPNPNSPTGRCDGVIDYDAGYNYLRCTKCGVKYRAKELEKKIKSKEIFVKGETKMKFVVKSGFKGNDKERNEAMLNSNNGSFYGRSEVSSVKEKPHINKFHEVKQEPEVVEKEPIVIDSTETVVEEKPAVEVKPTTRKRMSVNGASETSGKISPISFGERTAPKADNGSPLKNIEKLCKDLVENFKAIELDSVRKEAVDRISSVFDVILESADADTIVALCNTLAGVLLDGADNVSKLAENKLPFILASENIKSFISKFYATSVGFEKDEEDVPTFAVSINADVDNENSEIFKEYFDIDIKDISDLIKEMGYEDEENGSEPSGKDDYTMIKAKIGYLNDVLIDCKAEKVIFLIDNDGQYITDENNNIYVVGNIDSKDVDSVRVVSEAWLQSVIDIAHDNSSDEPSETENEMEEDTEVVENSNLETRKVVRGDMFNTSAEIETEIVEEEPEYSEAEVVDASKEFCEKLKNDMMSSNDDSKGE
jgi:hypothetical protein